MIRAALKAQGIACELDSRRVLDAVSLTLQPGRLTGIIGANGAGKSTLLSVLAGLQRNYSGSVMLGDTPLPELPAKDRSKRIAYLPQNPEVHWDLSVRQVVGLGRIPHQPRFSWFGTSNDADQAAIADAMTATQCDHLSNRTVRSLSGGEQLRVHLARTFAVQAPVIMVDEPTNGLDPFHQLRCLETLQARAQDDQCTVVMVLHDLSLAARFCDDVLLLHQGKTLAFGQPAQVLVPDNLRQAYRIQPPQETATVALNLALWDSVDD